ncbi:MAG: hypothetical protein U0905_17320 [Pirellulales bacterium]
MSMNKRRIHAWLGIFAIALPWSGCKYQGDGYPQVQTSAVEGVAQRCHQCGKPIDQPTTDQVLQLGAAKYFACGEACKTKLQQWHAQQFGR